MPTAKEYRQRAEECSRLARSASELYVKVALAELAQEFHRSATELEARAMSYDEVAARSFSRRARSQFPGARDLHQRASRQ
jgi:hypothetical protein